MYIRSRYITTYHVLVYRVRSLKQKEGSYIFTFVQYRTPTQYELYLQPLLEGGRAHAPEKLKIRPRPYVQFSALTYQVYTRYQLCTCRWRQAALWRERKYPKQIELTVTSGQKPHFEKSVGDKRLTSLILSKNWKSSSHNEFLGKNEEDRSGDQASW